MILGLILAATFSIADPALLASVQEAEAVAGFWAKDPVCQVLFPAPARAPVVLNGQSYYDPPTKGWTETCSDAHAIALTPVGSSRVVICPAFARESLPWRVATIIHEALHSSGVGEQTITSAQIQFAVLALCDPANRPALKRMYEDRKREVK